MKITSADGPIIEIPWIAAERAELVRGLRDFIKSDEPIEIPYVSNFVLNKVLEWCCYNGHGTQIHNSESITHAETWKDTYIETCQDVIIEVLNSASYLGVDDLVHFGCKTLASTLAQYQGKSPELVKRKIEGLHDAIQYILLDYADLATFEILRTTTLPYNHQYHQQLIEILHHNEFARMCKIENAYKCYSTVLSAQRCLSNVVRLEDASSCCFLTCSAVHKLGFSADQEYMFSLDRDNHVLKVWQLQGELPECISECSGVVDAVFGSSTLVTADQFGDIRAFHPSARIKDQATWHLGRKHALFCRNKGFLAIGAEGVSIGLDLRSNFPHTVFVWDGDLETPPLLSDTFMGAHNAAFSGDGQGVFTTYERLVAVNGQVSSTVTLHYEHQYPDLVLRSALHGVVVALTIADITFWWPREESGQVRKLDATADDHFEAAEFSPDGQFLAIGCSSGKIILLKMHEADFEEVGRFHLAQIRALRTIAWSPDGQFLAAGSFGGIRLLHISDTMSAL